MFKAFFQRRRIKKALARHLSPELARKIVDGSFDLATTLSTLNERKIDFAFVAVSTPDAASYSEHAGIVSDIAFAHGGNVLSLLPVVVVGFGIFQSALARRSHSLRQLRAFSIPSIGRGCSWLDRCEHRQSWKRQPI
jgi:hypothetical protein